MGDKKVHLACQNSAMRALWRGKWAKPPKLSAAQAFGDYLNLICTGCIPEQIGLW